MRWIIDRLLWGSRIRVTVAVLIQKSSPQDLLTEAAQRFTANLASYAIPVFIRICNEVEKTGNCLFDGRDGFDGSMEKMLNFRHVQAEEDRPAEERIRSGES